MFHETPEYLSPVSKPTPTPAAVAKKLPVNPEAGLAETVRNKLEGALGTYGIAVQNPETGERYLYNEHTVFSAGSLYKLWVMAEVYEKISAGNLREEDILSKDVEELNTKFNIASDAAELTEGTIDLSVKDALNKMITLSDNYAALLLTERIGLSSVASFLKIFPGAMILYGGLMPSFNFCSMERI